MAMTVVTESKVTDSSVSEKPENGLVAGPKAVVARTQSTKLPRIYSSVSISLENPILPSHIVSESPSLKDTIDVEMERDLRFLGCELVQSASILLNLPQVAAATGQILYQRFYYCKSFLRYGFEHAAMACVYLASKIEESPRRIRDVMNCFNYMKLKRQRKQQIKPIMLDQTYVQSKNEVIKMERRVLKELGFCVHIKHPHKLIVSYLKMVLPDEVDEAVDEEQAAAKELYQKAWNYMNDGLRTDIFMRYPPETIACACIFLAARFQKVALPPAWFTLFDVDEADILQITEALLSMYNRKRPSWSQLEKEVSRIAEIRKAQELNRARMLGSDMTPAIGGVTPGGGRDERFSPVVKDSEQNVHSPHSSNKKDGKRDRHRSRSHSETPSPKRRRKRDDQRHEQRDNRLKSGRKLNDLRGGAENRQKNVKKIRSRSRSSSPRSRSPKAPVRRKEKRKKERNVSFSSEGSLSPREIVYRAKREQKLWEQEVRQTVSHRKRGRSGSYSPPAGNRSGGLHRPIQAPMMDRRKQQPYKGRSMHYNNR